MRRTSTVIVGAFAASLLMAGCAPGAAGDRPLQVAVGDGSLRTVGEDCAATAPYRHIHAGAELVLTDAEGDEALRATLTPGVAEAASDIDFEDTPRIPTICVFTVDAGSLPAGGTYAVEIDSTAHGDFTYAPEAEGIPTILVPELIPRGTE